MNHWDERFIELSNLVATWSRDPSTKVGAVIVDPNNRVVSMGFNGFAKGVEDSMTKYEDKDYKHQVVLHAETNAIMFAKQDLHGCTLYSSFPTCAHCASQIIQSGIKFVIHKENGTPKRWFKSAEIAKQMYLEAGVRYIVLDGEKCE